MADETTVTVREIKNGWLAWKPRPKLAGYGKTPEEATADLEAAIARFERGLSAYYQRAAARVMNA